MNAKTQDMKMLRASINGEINNTYSTCGKIKPVVAVSHFHHKTLHKAL
jgi:hypothetical protein